jgi:alpha-1,6-mannosyltransferase
MLLTLKHPMAPWLGIGAALTGFAAVLSAHSHRFDWQLSVDRMPAATLALGLAAAGALYLAVLPTIRRSLAQPADVQRRLVTLMLAIGLGLRLMLLFSEPALEDDYNRYLWEGALTANGISPYAISPVEASESVAGSRLAELSQEGAPVLARVNHAEHTSTYPPVAQAAFALAYLISPWSLYAWRFISLACDAATVTLLLLLLKETRRAALWAALYWWNPLVIKELVNSAHMEGLVVALVLGALLLSVRGRHGWALVIMGLAIGAKLWPILLVPLILRPLWPHTLPFAAGLILICAMACFAVLPLWIGGHDAQSGLDAYARHWSTNSALFPLLETLSKQILRPWSLDDYAWAIARAAVAIALADVAVWQARRPIAGARDELVRAGVVTTWLVLLSPAQFPWYAIWMLPFAAFKPRLGMLVATVTLPLYYLSFHLMVRGSYPIFSNWIVWCIWLPIWILLAAEALQHVTALKWVRGRR